MGYISYRCAGCGVEASERAKTACDCPTNVLFSPDDRYDTAAKDRYYMSQIDTAGGDWPRLSMERRANLERVAERLRP